MLPITTPLPSSANGVFFDLSNLPKVSVIIPTLNEANNLPHVLPWIPDWVHEVIIVDGYSTDGTPDIATRLRKDVRVVQQEGRGKGAALRTGFAAAQGEIIIMLDADGSTDPTEIPHYVGALLAGADFAKGSRFLQGGGTADMSLIRKFGNWSFVTLVRMLFGGNYSDLCYGYNAFWKRVVPLLRLNGDGFEIETMMNIRALRVGLKIVEIPSFEACRVYGVGRLRAIPDGWRVLKTIAKEAAEQFNQAKQQAMQSIKALRSRATLRKPLNPAKQPLPQGKQHADEFLPTMQALMKEAVQISRYRDQLPNDKYLMTKEQIVLLFQDLLSMPVNTLEASHVQHQYKRYSGGNPFKFLDTHEDKGHGNYLPHDEEVSSASLDAA